MTNTTKTPFLPLSEAEVHAALVFETLNYVADRGPVTFFEIPTRFDPALRELVAHELVRDSDATFSITDEGNRVLGMSLVAAGISIINRAVGNS